MDRKSLRRAGAILAIAIPNLAIGGSNSIYGEIGTGVVSRTVSDFSPLFLVGVVLALVGCAYLGTVTLRAVVWRLTGGETRSWRALGTVKGGLLLIAATGGAIVAWLALFGLSVMVFVPSPTV